MTPVYLNLGPRNVKKEFRVEKIMGFATIPPRSSEWHTWILPRFILTTLP